MLFFERQSKLRMMWRILQLSQRGDTHLGITQAVLHELLVDIAVQSILQRRSARTTVALG